MTAASRPLRLLVAAGGTGGHIFPALAVVEQLETDAEGALDVTFLGSANRMEATMIPRYGYSYTAMPIRGFTGLFRWATLALPWRILASELIALRVMKQFRPDVVLATGAYISYPVGRVATRLGIPLVLMESNVNPGKTNAALAPKATAIIATFAESVQMFSGVSPNRIHVFGNPVRKQIFQAPLKAAARQQLGLMEEMPTVLVVGGSLGARSINQAVQAMVHRWASTRTAPAFQMIWQTGADFTPNIAPHLQNHIITTPFLESMGTAYAAADLVVSRSGATTIAELGVMGLPAVLVPLPSASTNEQRRNAEIVERSGAAIVVDDAELKNSLADVIEALMVDRRRREMMASAMRTLGKPMAAEHAAQLIRQLAHEHSAS